MKNSPPEHNACLVVLTDTLYMPGTIRLISSWQKHNPAIPVIALSAEPSALQNQYLIEHCEQRIAVDIESYERIKPFKKSRSKRHEKTFYKFEAFSDFGYEQNIFIDSDIVCLRPAPLLLERATSQLQAAPEIGFRKTRGYKGHSQEFNSGVLIIEKSIQGSDTIERLKEIAIEKPGRSGYNSGDQGILNKWRSIESIDFSLLPSSYNLIKKDYNDENNVDDCRLLHFAARKPWFESSTATTPLEKLWHVQS